MPLPSELDVRFLALIRENINQFMKRAATQYASVPGGRFRLLDVAPQDHTGARPYFPAEVEIDTLDIASDSNATFVADLCENNEKIVSSSRYDFVVCTEVLEHTLRPFDAIKEILRILKPGGILFLSVPLNFRIHGPLPDCWRFTEHGLKAILSDFKILDLNALESPDRPLMPIHYTVIARKP